MLKNSPCTLILKFNRWWNQIVVLTWMEARSEAASWRGHWSCTLHNKSSMHTCNPSYFSNSVIVRHWNYVFYVVKYGLESNNFSNLVLMASFRFLPEFRAVSRFLWHRPRVRWPDIFYFIARFHVHTERPHTRPTRTHTQSRGKHAHKRHQSPHVCVQFCVQITLYSFVLWIWSPVINNHYLYRTICQSEKKTRYFNYCAS